MIISVFAEHNFAKLLDKIGLDSPLCFGYIDCLTSNNNEVINNLRLLDGLDSLAHTVNYGAIGSQHVHQRQKQSGHIAGADIGQ